MEKIVQFRTKGLSYDILADTAGSLGEEVYGRYNICIKGDQELSAFINTSFEAGRDIFYICLSDTETAEKTAAGLMTEYPGRRIICVDMPSVSEEDCLKAVKMSRLRAAGATLDEVASYYKNHRQTSPVSFPASRYSRPMATAISM